MRPHIQILLLALAGLACGQSSKSKTELATTDSHKPVNSIQDLDLFLRGISLWMTSLSTYVSAFSHALQENSLIAFLAGV